MSGQQSFEQGKGDTASTEHSREPQEATSSSSEHVNEERHYDADDDISSRSGMTSSKHSSEQEDMEATSSEPMEENEGADDDHEFADDDGFEPHPFPGIKGQDLDGETEATSENASDGWENHAASIEEYYHCFGFEQHFRLKYIERRDHCWPLAELIRNQLDLRSSLTADLRIDDDGKARDRLHYGGSEGQFSAIIRKFVPGDRNLFVDVSSNMEIVSVPVTMAPAEGLDVVDCQNEYKTAKVPCLVQAFNLKPRGAVVGDGYFTDAQRRACATLPPECFVFQNRKHCLRGIISLHHVSFAKDRFASEGWYSGTYAVALSGCYRFGLASAYSNYRLLKTTDYEPTEADTLSIGIITKEGETWSVYAFWVHTEGTQLKVRSSLLHVGPWFRDKDEQHLRIIIENTYTWAKNHLLPKIRQRLDQCIEGQDSGRGDSDTSKRQKLS